MSSAEKLSHSLNLKVNSLLKEIYESKLTEYEDLTSELEDILDIIDNNYSMAVNQFNQLPISKYESFAIYTKNTTSRAKTTRQRRNLKKCENCGNMESVKSEVLICSVCGTPLELKNKATNKINQDHTKHIYKQLDSIVGTKKPPVNINKIIRFIKIWLTDLKFIRDWLEYSNKKQSWLKSFNEHTDELNFDFDVVVRDSPENAWSYPVFKMFMDEFYLMLEEARNRSKITTNLDGLAPELIYEIFQSVSGEIPDTIVYKGCSYEAKQYLKQLSILVNAPETHIKSKIEKLFSIKISLPGLMFNFNEIYSKNENVPRKYNYQQEFAFIIHESFNKPYVNIPKSDKEAIFNIILKFNEYYKNECFKETGKHTNAPLYCCSLMSVLDLPCLSKYKEILTLIPMKDRSAYTNINTKWFKFINDNEEFIKQYIQGSAPKTSANAVSEAASEEGTFAYNSCLDGDCIDFQESVF
jgi:hypothetical protein